MINKLLKYAPDALRIALIEKRNVKVVYAIDPYLLSSYLGNPPASDSLKSISSQDDLFLKTSLGMLLDSNILEDLYFLHTYKIEMQDILDFKKNNMQWIIRHINENAEKNIKSLRNQIADIFGTDEQELDALTGNQIEQLVSFIKRNFYELYVAVSYSDFGNRLSKVIAIRNKSLGLKVKSENIIQYEERYHKFLNKKRTTRAYANLVDAQAFSLIYTANESSRESNEPDSRKCVILISTADIMFDTRDEFEELNNYKLFDDLLVPLVVHPYSVLLYLCCRESLDNFIKLLKHDEDRLLRINMESISSELIKNSQIEIFVKDINSKAEMVNQNLYSFFSNLTKSESHIEKTLSELRLLYSDIQELLTTLTDKEIEETKSKNFLIYGIYLFEIEYSPETATLLEAVTMDTRLEDLLNSIDELKRKNLEDAYHLSAYLNGKLDNHKEAEDDILKGENLCGLDEGKKRKYYYLRSINLSNMGHFEKALEVSIENSKKFPEYPRFLLHVGYMYWEKYCHYKDKAYLKLAMDYTVDALKLAEKSDNYCHCTLIGNANLVRYYSEANEIEKGMDKLLFLNQQINKFRDEELIINRLPLFDYVTAYLGLKRIMACSDLKEKSKIYNEMKFYVDECRKNLLIANKYARKEYALLIRDYMKIKNACVNSNSKLP